MDHSTPTDPAEVFGRVPIKVESAARQVQELEKNCREFGVELLGLGSEQRGIVHVIGPELGATQPGKTIVCGDSHTATHGAFGALAFGIGTTEVGHVLATQCLLQRRPKTLAIEVDGRLRRGVTAKDLILAIIGKIGVSGGTGHVIEYRGSAIEALSMDERMTVCNMSIEAGARAGMIAPDETTFAYLQGPPLRSAGRGVGSRRRALARICGPTTARVSTASSSIDASELEPMITYGTNPGMVVPIDGDGAGSPERRRCTRSRSRTWACEAASRCSANPSRSCSSAAAPTRACPICEPPRACCAAARSHSGVRMLVVPGSQQVKREAEARGLDKVFTRRRRRMARVRLLDVHRHERRHRRAGPVRGEHQQPQLRRPPGQGRAHVARESR